MKKKILLTLSLLAVMCLLSGCMAISGSRLESMFGTGGASTVQAGNAAAGTAANTGDTVTISKAEYERLARFKDLAELYDACEIAFFREPDTDQMLEYAARGLMAGLGDPYSYYYSPEEYAQMWEDDTGEYVGIGVMILSYVKEGYCVITRVFQGGPAEAAGVQRGDILYRVGEDLYVTPENLTEAVKIMRGEEGTDVDVTFLRNEEEITFTITRKAVKVNEVDSTLLEDGIGMIALYEFSGEAEVEFENALNALLKQGIKGLIIDLRDNSGGWVDQARYIGDLFMDKGEVCYLVYRDGEEEHRYYRTTDGKADVQLVILVNENSASSSEILTGALRDCADATVVGTNSFGKGIIQEVMPIGNNGAGFQLTIAEYMTPKGNKVHEVGIKPDVEVERAEGDEKNYEFADVEHDIQLKTALEVMREKLK